MHNMTVTIDVNRDYVEAQQKLIVDLIHLVNKDASIGQGDARTYNQSFTEAEKKQMRKSIENLRRIYPSAEENLLENVVA